MTTPAELRDSVQRALHHMEDEGSPRGDCRACRDVYQTLALIKRSLDAASAVGGGGSGFTVVPATSGPAPE